MCSVAIKQSPKSIVVTTTTNNNKNLMLCYEEYSYHIQGHSWQTQQLFKA